MTKSGTIRLSDIAEMLVGAVPLAYPVVVTEEVWKLGESLTWTQAFFLWFSASLVIGWYGTHVFQAGNFSHNWGKVVTRVIAVQALTFVVCALLLLLVGKWPIATEPAVAIKRTLLVLFPAAFSATIVDGLDR